MPCTINNPANIDLRELEPHIQGMYDHFDQKLSFKKPPTMVFDSDPNNQASILGKTAYYDPQSLEIHIYSDGRHPKDMLRSIAHELIHHHQNMEGRLDVGGYNGPGYYLENDKLRKIEHEAMLEGNALMREYEDTIKKENNQMSLKEWKNNELNTLLLKKFGILTESVTSTAETLDKEEEVVEEQQETEIEEELEESKDKKPDADGDGIPDWADKKDDADDKLEKEEVSENKVNLKEVVRKVLENNKRVMQKLKDK